MFNFYLINEYSELNAPSPFNSSAEVALMFRTKVSGILREGELLKYQVFTPLLQYLTFIKRLIG